MKNDWEFRLRLESKRYGLVDRNREETIVVVDDGSPFELIEVFSSNDLRRDDGNSCLITQRLPDLQAKFVWQLRIARKP